MSLDKLFGVQRKIIDRPGLDPFKNVEHLENYLLNYYGLEDDDEVQFKLAEVDTEGRWFEGVVRIVDKKIYEMSNMTVRTVRELRVESVSRMKPTISADSDTITQSSIVPNMKVLAPSGKYVFLKAVTEVVTCVVNNSIIEGSFKL